MKCCLFDGNVYLDFETVHDKINSRFFWDANENKLLYTTATDLISTDAESTTYYVTKDARTLDHTIVKADASTAYIAIDFVKQYSDFDYTVYDQPNRVVLTNQWGDYNTAPVKKSTELRYQGGIKSPILADLAKGTVLTVLEPDETWTKVMTDDGIICYVKTKALGSTSTATRTSDYTAEEFSHIKKDFSINLGWHQVTNSNANTNIANVLSNTKGLNVISPTWFYLKDTNGGIGSLASSDYVNYCHQNGVEVWALVSNFGAKDQGLESPDTTQVLTYSSRRESLINNLISAAIQYKLDGINVDFESLDPSIGDSYIQFIRELSLKCANNGIVLSVDNYPPTAYTAFYNRSEQLLKHGLSVVILHLYDIKMPSAVRLRQLIWRHNICAVRKRLIVALCDLPSACKEAVQLPHLAAAERTLDIRHAVIIAEIELLIEPRSLISRHQLRISGNSMTAEQH